MIPRHLWSASIRLLALAAVCSLGLLAPARGQVVPQRIAAVVNDDVITSQDLIDRLNLAIATGNLPNDAATRQRLAPQVLRGLVDEKLQLQEAKRLGQTPSDAEVDQAVTTVAQRNRTTGPELLNYLSQRGLNPATLREQLRAQVAWLKVLGREVRPRIVVTQEQIDLAMKRSAVKAGDRELLISEILLPVYSRGQEASVTDDARGLVATLRGGASFAALARQVSASASAQNGGDLGWVRVSAITPDLRDQIEALPVGQISDPIVSPAGVHIFQVRDQRAVAAAAPQDRAAVEQTIQQEQIERQSARYLRDLRRDAFVDVRL
ncbi:MAG TPA: peptidylprolyl isomerase [Gaiellales bacterium]|nr:peptidylprolyl isomerase [Gaiellales bacterium]